MVKAIKLVKPIKKPTCHWCEYLATQKTYRILDGISTKTLECHRCAAQETTYLCNRESDVRISELLLEVEDLRRYKKGYRILSEFWDSIPDELKDQTDKKLTKLGL